MSLTCINPREKLDVEEAVGTTSHNAEGRALVARHVCGKAKSTTGGAK